MAVIFWEKITVNRYIKSGFAFNLILEIKRTKSTKFILIWYTFRNDSPFFWGNGNELRRKKPKFFDDKSNHEKQHRNLKS